MTLLGRRLWRTPDNGLRVNSQDSAAKKANIG